jgi:cellulose synthase/poly-beta-1,6-N-acetylglucosamine synthase-like glycosyltransferase
MLISILISTRNRSEKLRRTLDAICALEVPSGAEYEVLVIENGPESAETPGSQEELESTLRGRLRRFHLPVPGKSAAANAGFAASCGQILAFLDDDILPRKDWLTVIFQEFAANSELAAISGPVELLNHEDLPVAVRRHQERTVFSSVTDAYNLFIGCNFAVRRATVETVGLFDPNLGPGRPINTNEDVDFFYRVWRTGQKLVYVPSLYVYHGHGRRSHREEIDTKRAYTVGRGAFFAKHVLHGGAALRRTIRWEIQSEIRSLLHGDSGSLRRLGWLMSGFLRYAFLRASQAMRLSATPTADDRG